MVERSYSNAQLVEIIREALARTPGRYAQRELGDGIDLATVLYALRNSRAEASPETYSSLRAEALTVLRAALAPTGPFIAIPKLGRNFHIRMGRDSRMEVVTGNRVLAGREIILQLRDKKHPGGRLGVPQELIDELDREACAALAGPGKRLTKDARAAFIRERLAKRDRHLTQRRIENRLKAMPR